MYNPKYSQDLTGLCTCDVEDLDYQGGSFIEIGGHIGGKRRLPKPAQIRTPGQGSFSVCVHSVSFYQYSTQECHQSWILFHAHVNAHAKIVIRGRPYVCEGYCGGFFLMVRPAW